MNTSLSDEIVKCYNSIHDYIGAPIHNYKKFLLTGGNNEVTNEYPKLGEYQKLMKFDDVKLEFDDSKISNEIVPRMFKSSYNNWIQTLSYKLCRIVDNARDGVFDESLVTDWNEYYSTIKDACVSYVEYINRSANNEPKHFNIC